MFKKKFHGGLKVLLLLLFIMLLGMYSTCYAEPNNLTPSNMMTPEIAKEIVDYLYNNSVYSSIRGANQSILNSYRELADYDQFCELWNSNGIENYCDCLEQCIFIAFQVNGVPKLGVHFVNNTIGNTLPFLLIEYNQAYIYDRKIFYRDDAGNKISGLRYWITFNSGGTITLINNSELPADGNTIIGTGSDWWSVNDNILYYKMLFTYHFPGYIYYNNAWRRNDEITVLEYIDPNPSPEPDILIDTGNTGQITNNSGDVTGNIDLSGIQAGIAGVQNQISGDTQKIINNQNQNTEQIVNAVNGANQNYWGNSGELTGDDQEDFISDSINSLVSDVSGELNSNAIFEHLDTAENVFLDFFRNKQDESFYDLIISWDSIAPVFTMFGGSVTVSSGQSIISGDSINISQLCRNNPELAKIQQYIRIIFNFACLIALLWQIYNLILSTLGIDNPYLYEDADVTDVVNSDTGEVRTYYKTHKRYYKK